MIPITNIGTEWQNIKVLIKYTALGLVGIKSNETVIYPNT